MSRPLDPVLGHRFLVEVEGEVLGDFAKVRGLESEVVFEEFQEGGNNEFTHRLASSAKHPALSLERGWIEDDRLWQWHLNVVRGFIDRLDVTVVLRDHSGADLSRWIAQGAFPTKWSMAELDASTAKVHVETIELQHQGVVRGGA